MDCMDIEPTELERRECRELERKLAEITEGYRHHSEVIFNALQNQFLFWLSQVCPNCREQYASQFNSNIPKILAAANRQAAAKPHNTCH